MSATYTRLITVLKIQKCSGVWSASQDLETDRVFTAARVAGRFLCAKCTCPHNAWVLDGREQAGCGERYAQAALRNVKKARAHFLQKNTALRCLALVLFGGRLTCATQWLSSQGYMFKEMRMRGKVLCDVTKRRLQCERQRHICFEKRNPFDWQGSTVVPA